MIFDSDFHQLSDFEFELLIQGFLFVFERIQTDHVLSGFDDFLIELIRLLNEGLNSVVSLCGYLLIPFADYFVLVSLQCQFKSLSCQFRESLLDLISLGLVFRFIDG